MNNLEAAALITAPILTAAAGFFRGRSSQKRTEASANARAVEATEQTGRFVIGDRAEHNRALLQENAELREENTGLREANAELRVTVTEQRGELAKTRGELAAAQAAHTRVVEELALVRARFEQDTERKRQRLDELTQTVTEQGHTIGRLLREGLPG